MPRYAAVTELTGDRPAHGRRRERGRGRRGRPRWWRHRLRRPKATDCVRSGAHDRGRGRALRPGLVEAAWAVFDRVAAVAPAELRKGPRGGGRDTAKVVVHVDGADHAYAQVMGIKTKAPDRAQPGTVSALRDAMLEASPPCLRRFAHRRPQVAAPLRGPPHRLARTRPRLEVLEDRTETDA